VAGRIGAGVDVTQVDEIRLGEFCTPDRMALANHADKLVVEQRPAYAFALEILEIADREVDLAGTHGACNRIHRQRHDIEPHRRRNPHQFGHQARQVIDLRHIRHRHAKHALRHLRIERDAFLDGTTDDAEGLIERLMQTHRGFRRQHPVCGADE
jgi:hypothetical protein